MWPFGFIRVECKNESFSQWHSHLCSVLWHCFYNQTKTVWIGFKNKWIINILAELPEHIMNIHDWNILRTFALTERPRLQQPVTWILRPSGFTPFFSLCSCSPPCLRPCRPSSRFSRPGLWWMRSSVFRWRTFLQDVRSPSAPSTRARTRTSGRPMGTTSATTGGRFLVSPPLNLLGVWSGSKSVLPDYPDPYVGGGPITTRI